MVSFGIRYILIAPDSSNKSEDIEEDVDDIQIQSLGCEDILLWGDGVLVAAPHHHLRVVHQVEGEEGGPGASVHHLHVLGVRDEDHHDPEDHQPHQQAHQDPAHRSEVPLGLNNIVSMNEVMIVNIDVTIGEHYQ